MTARRSRWLNLVAAAIPLTVVALALTFVLVARSGSTTPASADFPHAGLDLAIGAGTCDSSSGVANCNITNVGDHFTADFKVVTLPGDFPTGGYAGYDWSMDYTGVTLVDGTLVQQGAGAWPACTFPASVLSVPGHISVGCAYGISAASSTYIGVLVHIDFACTASGTLTLVDDSNTATSQNPHSDLLDADLAAHGESNGQDVLNIQCGLAPTPTDTPAATATPCPDVCPTDTPTPTSPPATDTPTATQTPELQLGDVNGDGVVNSIDALWVLWYTAGIVDHVAHPENADLNHDTYINSIDAAIILQIEAGLYTP